MNRFTFVVTLALVILTGCSQQSQPDRQAELRALQDREVAAFVKDWSGKVQR